MLRDILLPEPDDVNKKTRITSYNVCYTKLLRLVVLDVGLPDTDGRELCKKLRKQGVKCPIVMLTGHDQPAAADNNFGSLVRA